MTVAGRALWSAVTLLVIIGIIAAYGRTVRVADLTTRAGPLRAHLLDYLGRNDPLLAERPAEFERFDRPFARHPLLARLHVVPGGLFLALAPFQFSRWIRGRYVELHRWSGRVLILIAFVSTSSALFFGVFTPFGGWAETIAIVTFGGLFLVAITKAFLAIRGRHVAQHREWMIRAFAIALGISTIRVLGAVLDYALAPAAFRAEQIFVLSIWIGWILMLGTAEMWIRYTRRGARTLEPHFNWSASS